MATDEQVIQFIRDQFEQVNNRLDQHFELFQQHVEEDKKLSDHIIAVDKEVTFAKGVTYAINAMSAIVAWLFGWAKQ